MLNQPDADHLEQLRAETRRILRDAIGATQDVALIDAPNQRNVGDSLIWEGEIAYLERLGCNIRYVCDLNGYDAADLRRALPQGGTVLLHGGGNFGDLWLGHQELRERVVQDLPDYRIVQLSQSIFFASIERAREADRVLGAHADFRVLIRDSLSIERAETILPSLKVTFCPDMALGYSPAFLRNAPHDPQEVLVIARADKESASGLSSVDPDWLTPHRIHVTDWGLHAKDPFAWRFARLVARFNHKLVAVRRRFRVPVPTLPQWMIKRVITTINKLNADSALRLYSSARIVVVDRLHAHVLSMLLGLPHVMLDNNYRKLRGVFDDYTGAFSTAHYSDNLADAQTQARDLLDA